VTWWFPWRRGCEVVSALPTKGRWFDAQSLSSCCFLRQETLPLSTQILCLPPPSCINGYRDILLGAGGNPAMDQHRGEWQYSRLLHAPETGKCSGHVSFLSRSATLSFFLSALFVPSLVRSFIHLSDQCVTFFRLSGVQICDK